MKLAVLSLSLVTIFSLEAAAQKNDISASKFLAVEQTAQTILETSSYRMTRVNEYFEDRDRPGTVVETLLKEVLQPDKWRTVEERSVNGRMLREERLWNGKALFVRTGDGVWEKYSGGSSSGGRLESGHVTTRYRYLGKGELSGAQVDIYESETLRIANKFSMTDLEVVRYGRKTKIWYGVDGRLLRKIEENTSEGREEITRETISIEYEPKISIEAPIK